MKKQWVNGVHAQISTFESLEGVIKILVRASKQKDWKDLHLQIANDFGDMVIEIHGKRLETNQEYKERQDREAKDAIAQEKFEEMEYRRLKEKFEKK